MASSSTARLILLGAAALALGFGAIAPAPARGADSTTIATDAATLRHDTSAMVEAINTQRAIAGLAPLAADPRLADLAGARSQDQIARHYFSHVTPDGMTLFDFLNAAGVRWSVAGENLAESNGLDPVPSSIDGFMTSPEHRENVLDPSYGHVGVGVAAGADRTVIISVVFTD